MTASLTDWLQQSRLMVVEVDRDRGRLRVKGDACSDLSCHARTVVVTEDGRLAGVEALYPGDIVRLETQVVAGGEADGAEVVARVIVLRRVWEGIASPEV